MKSSFFLVILLLAGSMQLLAQTQPDFAIRLIKIGNTYRESLQFTEAERVLKSGLKTVSQQGNTYWEAVADENLGFLYRDLGDSLQAAGYFNNALQLYQKLNLDGSRLAMEQLTKSMKRRTSPDIYAGVDIGSTGVKLSFVSVSLGAEGRYVYNIVKDTSINSRFADVSPSSFTATREAVKTFTGLIRQQNIPGDHIFILFSSGALQALNGKGLTYNSDSIARDYTTMIHGIIPAYSDTVKFLTPQKEGLYTSMGIVFPRSRRSSVLLDIGGGNTKGGYYDNGEFAPLAMPYGTRSLVLGPQDTRLPEATNREVISVLNQNPLVQTKTEVFLLGGIVWAMMNYLYPEKAFTDFSEFTYEDIQHFKTLASTDYAGLQSYTQDKLDKISDPVKQRKATETVKNVQHVFTPDNLRKGAILLEGIADALHSPTVNKHFYFINNGGDIAYITGYIVYNISKKYSAAKESK